MSKRMNTRTGKGWLNGQYQVGWEHDGKSFEEILQLDKFKTTGGSSAVRRQQTKAAMLFWMRGQLRVTSRNWSVYTAIKDEIVSRMDAGHTVKDVKASVDVALKAEALAYEMAVVDKDIKRLERQTAIHKMRTEAQEEPSTRRSAERTLEASDMRDVEPDRRGPKTSRGELLVALNEIIGDAAKRLNGEGK